MPASLREPLLRTFSRCRRAGWGWEVEIGKAVPAPVANKGYSKPNWRFPPITCLNRA